MTKLCPRGKAAAKRKFKVYPSAYANAYASKICAGKIKDPSGVKRKDFRGSKAKGGRIGLKLAGLVPEDSPKRQPNKNIPKGESTIGPVPANKRKKFNPDGSYKKIKKAFDPKKSDLNKDGKLNSYEKKRGMAIAKAMRGRNKNV